MVLALSADLLLLDEPLVVAVAKRLHEKVEDAVAADETEHALRHRLAHFEQNLGELVVERTIWREISVHRTQ